MLHKQILEFSSESEKWKGKSSRGCGSSAPCQECVIPLSISHVPSPESPWEAICLMTLHQDHLQFPWVTLYPELFQHSPLNSQIPWPKDVLSILFFCCLIAFPFLGTLSRHRGLWEPIFPSLGNDITTSDF